MAVPADEIALWQSRLSRAFRGPSGIVGERLLQLSSSEQQVQTIAVDELRGFLTIGDALLDFSLHSISILSRPVQVYHLVRIPLLVASISRLRASYNLFWMGYYYDASALLRGLFENAVQLAADAHGLIELSQWFDMSGIDSTHSQLKKSSEMHRRRQQLARKAEGRIFRANSGLSKQDQDDIANLLGLMHSHVHRSEMHLIHLITDMQTTKQPASVLPAFDAHKGSHYANVSLATGWMLARLLSFAVPELRRDADWQCRRATLDDSLTWWFSKWEKPLGGAISRLVNQNFSFEGDWGEPSPCADL